LARVLDRCGLVSLKLRACQHFPTTRLTAVNYHRLVENGAESDTDEGVIDASPGGFSQQLGMLRQYYHPVSLEDLRQHVRAGQSLPPNPVLVTFDDGYVDNYTSALPILKSHGMKAAFFIATDYITYRRVFWWDRISWILKHARRNTFAIEYPIEVHFELGPGLSGPEKRLHGLVKSTHGLELERFLTELGRAADAPWSAAVERELADRLLMSWDQIRGLKQAGMEIGSHSRTHRVLKTVPWPELADELAGSRADLEQQLGFPVFALALPVGEPIAHLPQLRAAVSAAGYDLNFSYSAGHARLAPLDPLDIRRMAVERHWSQEHFRAVLAFRWLGY
jgi:peptidoglycan/xylan/chitin deacetylase (PgdA/CDA1 family)